MNKNYKTLPAIQKELNSYEDFNDFFIKKIDYQIYVITIDNMDKIKFYCDDTNKEIYFELSKKEFKFFSNDKLFKDRIKQIDKSFYQILTQQNSNTSINKQINELKLKLENIKPSLLQKIRVEEQKKSKYINFEIHKLNIWSPIELKNSVEELLKSLQSNNQEQSTTTQVNNNNEDNEPESQKIETIAIYDIFKHNYKNLEKNRIKEVLKVIPINKLQNLKLYKLDPNKKDKFDKLIKTNFKNYKKPILYYQLTDLLIIKQFLKQTKQGYDVKKCRIIRKQIVYNGIKICLSNNHKIIQNNIEYYINFDGKIYYYLVLFDNNNSKNNKRLVINHKNDLSNSQKEKIQTTYQKLENENIENKFNKMYDLLIEFTNFN